MVLSAFVLLVSLLVLSGRHLMLPSYAGKSVSDWFEQSLGMSSSQYDGSECEKAFLEMGRDALPFLGRWIVPELSAWDIRYGSIYDRLPVGVQKLLSPPRTLARCDRALILVAQIGNRQRFEDWEGRASRKPSATALVPQIRAILQNTNSTSLAWAAQAVTFLGPIAADAAPELLWHLERSSDADANLFSQALGSIGPKGAIAAPYLVNMARDSARSEHVRLFALQALTRFGPEASDVAPQLAVLLNESTNETHRVVAVRAIASMGKTPDEAVAPLKAMLESTNAWAVSLASLALWNRDPGSELLMANIRRCLASEQRGWMASTFAVLGPKAAAFKESVRLMETDTDPSMKVFAKRALMAMEEEKP